MTVIPGVATIHERTAWEESGYRMAVDFTRTPSLYVPGNVDRGVAHYTGAMNVPSGDPGENPNDVGAYLRAAQRDYLINRTGGGYTRRSDGRFFPGYPLGYSFGVDWLGGCWVIRGFDFLPAATNQHNGHTVAVLFYVDGADKATPEMWATARAIVREARRLRGRPGFNGAGTDHGTLTVESGTGTPTACAGAGIRSQLATEFNIDRIGITTRNGGTMLHTVTPKARIADTRSGIGVPVGLVDPVNGPLRVVIPPVVSADGAPVAPKTAIVNVTITDPTGPGFGQVDAMIFGGASDLNYTPGPHPPESGATICAVENGAIGVKLTGAPANVVVDLLGVVD